MKYLLLTVFTLVLFSGKSIAQQTRKTDDLLLLQYYQNQQFTEALTYLKNIYSEPVTDIKELANLAYTASMAGKLLDAENYYQRVYNADTTSLTALYNIAGITLRRGNNTKAAFYYKNYILKDSSNFSVYKQLALIAADRYDNTSRLKYLRKANQLDSTEFDVASDLADIYIRNDSLQSAEKVLNKALIADPENIILLQSLLALYSAQKKWKETVQTGERLHFLGDVAITTISKTGIAYYQLKNYLCALEALQSLGHDQQTETTNYFIAVCYKELKDPKNAIAFFNEAIKLSVSPATATYYNEMADSYEGIKQLNTALSTYKKALWYDNNPLTYYYMAALYDTKLKDKSNALKYYKKYAIAKPPKWQKGYVDYSVDRIAALGKY